jgi:class 3 adenylate cyclase/TolB-like protein
MAEFGNDAQLQGLRRATMAILVVDLVEFVRHMERDEEGTVHRWERFDAVATTHLIPADGGELVKSTGDGMLMLFNHVSAAVRCAFAMHQQLADDNAHHPPAAAMALRAGVHLGTVWYAGRDVQGRAVNMAARMLGLADPGGTVATAAAREHLADGLDAQIHDLGDCWIKHVDGAVRAYRLLPPDAPAGEARPAAPHGIAAAHDPTPPTLAVIPFDGPGAAPLHLAVGDLIADSVIAALAVHRELRVISRLSTSVLRGRSLDSADLQRHLGADFVLTGMYWVHGDRIVVSAELVDAASGNVEWAGRQVQPLADLLQRDSEIVRSLAHDVHRAVVDGEVRRAEVHPLPTLRGYTLLLGAVSMMHRQSQADFGRARKLLETLVDRHPRSAVAKAWLAKWFAVAAAQSWSASPQADALQARTTVQRALDDEPGNALAWSIRALLLGYVDRDFPAALDACEQALAHNPNEPLAWLYRAVVAGWRGDAAIAVPSAEAALGLSPLDPMKYYFDSLAAGALLGAGAPARAAELAQRSLRHNAMHVATYKVLAIAQVLSGDLAGARATAAELLRRQGDFTAGHFLRHSPWQASPQIARLAEALVEAGVPRH